MESTTPLRYHEQEGQPVWSIGLKILHRRANGPIHRDASSAKQRMKDKSIRFGYKNFWLTGSSGYPYYCVPYCGAKGVGGDPGKDLTSRITIQLALQIPSPESSEVFYDNWFSSYKLLPIFTAVGLGATSTLRNDRTNKCPLISDNMLKKEERGSYRYRTDIFSGSTILKWNDNNVVRLGSNIYGVEPIGSVQPEREEENNHYPTSNC